MNLKNSVSVSALSYSLKSPDTLAWVRWICAPLAIGAGKPEKWASRTAVPQFRHTLNPLA